MVTTIGIVGLGLIGGSLARRVRARGLAVTAWNHNPRPYAQARRDGIECVDTLEDLARSRPDLLMLCNPLRAMPEVLAALAPELDRTVTTLSDVGSVKAMVRDQVRDAGLADCYVGAHPMAGNERSGYEASDPALYDGALWAVTVDDRTSYVRMLGVARFITESVGNRLIVVDDRTHDHAAAMISHMPHAVSTAMINLLCDAPERDIAAAMAAGSWRDMTRVALTDPQRTRAMIEEDRPNVAHLLHDMAGRLNRFADALENRDDGAVTDFFAHGDPFRRYRRATAADVPALDAAAHDAPAHDAVGRGATQAGKDVTAGGDAMRVTLDDEGWRGQLLASACRGERIVRFVGDQEVEVVSRSLG